MGDAARVLALSVGGVLGVNARYWLGVWMARWTSPAFPWATFAINVSGSFAIGFGAVLLAGWSHQAPARLLTLVGFLGGYTTFSTFAFDSVTLWRRGAWGLSLANVLGSVGASVVAVLIGAALARGVESVTHHPRPADAPAPASSRPEHPDQAATWDD